jgi:hypothetical protein
MTEVTILGPQRLQPTISAHVASASLPDRPLAVVTAGWQEREDEDEELRAELPPGVINLRLYARWEQVLASDPEFFVLHRARQDRLRQLQLVYRERLGPLMKSARGLLRRDGPDDLLEPERADAIAMVQALDAHHLARVRAVLDEFETDVLPGARPSVAAHRAELAEIVSGCAGVVLAGGHVAVLLNRLQVFGMADLLAGQRLFAWSAGAMALCERVVLFHDNPPQGAGDAEVFGPGLGLAPGLVVLPHSKRRLTLADPTRVSLMARRFAPARCVPLDEGDGVSLTAGVPGPTGVATASAPRHLRPDGQVEVAA